MLESEITICNSFIQNRLDEGTDQKSICPLSFLDTLCCRSNYKALLKDALTKIKNWYLQTLAPKPVHLAAEVSVQPWRWRKFFVEIWSNKEMSHANCAFAKLVPGQQQVGWKISIYRVVFNCSHQKISKCKNKPKYTGCFFFTGPALKVLSMELVLPNKEKWLVLSNALKMAKFLTNKFSC